jgi:hypothetical protein
LKKQNPSVGPVKVDFLSMFFMLFDAILTAVVKSIAFNRMKIIQGTCLGLFFAQKVVFQR